MSLSPLERLVRPHLRCSLAAATALLTTATLASSQPSTPSPTSTPPPVQPPRLLSDPVVPYPDEASGDGQILLELVVAPDGSVRDVAVAEGEEPFASIALRAARTWLFEPALRNGRPVAARIRFQVRFRAPAPRPEFVPEPAAGPRPVAPPAPASGSGQPAPRPSAAPPPPIASPPTVDVFVYGEKAPPSAASMTRAEVRQLPGAFGDPFRAIEAMPGVTPLVTGAPFFYVRGAPPGNVGYFLDGIRVPLLYHIALGPSVIHPGIVQRVDLHPGGYPAQFGRFAGGIVAAETTPEPVALRGELSARLIDAGVLLEDAFDHGAWRGSIGGRYSYTAAALSLLSPEVVLSYWDYQLRLRRTLDAANSLGVFAFGAYDYLGEKRNGTTKTVAGTEFHRIDIRYDYDPSPLTHVRTALTLGFDRTRGEEDEDVFVRDRLVAVRTDLRHRLDRESWLRAGADVTVDFYDVKYRQDEEPVAVRPGAGGGEDGEEEFRRIFPERNDVAVGAYASVSLEPSPGVTVTPGLRGDFYRSDGASALGIDPRVSVRFELSDTVQLLHTLGVAHQPPSFAVPVPGFQIGGLRGGLQSALQSSAALQVELPEDITASATLFHNVFFDMTDSIGTARTEGDDFEDRLEQRSLGRSYGMELYLRRRLTRRLGGFVAYTLSRSERAVGRTRGPSRFDRTHVLNVAAAYDLGRRWRAGSRFTYYSGVPLIDPEYALAAEPPPPRAPGFYRVDLRLEKRWTIGSAGAWWALVFELLNATLNREVVDYDCDGQSCTEELIGPVTIPSIGVEIVF